MCLEPVIYKSKLLDSKHFTSLVLDAFLKPFKKCVVFLVALISKMKSKLLSNYLPEIFALALGRSKPSMVTVNLTDQCNQQCIYCEIGKRIPAPTREKLTLDDLKWIIDQMSLNHIPKISLCGGEPFLFKGLLDVIAIAGLKKINCSITTNGMTAYKLNNSNLNTIKDSNTEINVSIDSFQKNTESFLRGSQNALANSLKSIEVLNKKGIPVTVLTAISKYNYHELFTTLTTAYDKGIKQMLFQPIISFSNYPELQPIDNKSKLNVNPENIDTLMDQLNKILKFEKKHRIRTNVYRIYPWIQYYLETVASQNGNWFFDDVLNNFYCREILKKERRLQPY